MRPQNYELLAPAPPRECLGQKSGLVARSAPRLFRVAFVSCSVCCCGCWFLLGCLGTVDVLFFACARTAVVFRNRTVSSFPLLVHFCFARSGSPANNTHRTIHQLAETSRGQVRLELRDTDFEHKNYSLNKLYHLLNRAHFYIWKVESGWVGVQCR